MTAALTAVALAAAVVVWPGRPRRAGSYAAAAAVDTAPATASTTGTSLPDVVMLDLVCAALSAGLPTAAAVEAARTSAGGVGTSPAGAPDLLGHPGLARALRLSERTGASAAVLLRRAADDARVARREAIAVATGRLGVRLVLPLGLTVLPAFVLLGVVPVVLGLAHGLLQTP